MTAANSTDFQAYLESICSDEKYLGWQDFYTPTDALHRQRIEKKQPPRRLNLSLMVQTIVPPRETEAPGEKKAEKEKVERLEVLAGLRKYADNHLLLVGKPGSGKSTALERLLWEEAEKARTQPPEKILVLVELRRYKTSVLGIIGDFLFQHRCRLNETEIEQLLLAGRFLLLVDGWNELPDDKARGDVKNFREKYQRFTPMIFTTRELAGDIGIEKKLEMQPLTEAQMRQFVLTYLPEEGERLLKQLQGRLRELGETPLLLWMLCEVFDPITGNIPSNLGLVFRCFGQSYDSQIKQDVSTDESRSRWFLLLQHLAFEMMRGKTATDLRVTIQKQEAEDILTRFLTANQFDKPRERAFNWLNDLLKYHLIQLTNSNREIEFHHQLLQEYYAAERLLLQLPNLSDDTLKRDYLNYLKWTEPLALMLALVEDEEQALRVVKLALEVDLQLGARLAGEVKLEFQEKTVDLVVELEIPHLLKIEFLGRTRSPNAIPSLSKALKDENNNIRKKATEALGNIPSETAILVLHEALKDNDINVRRSAAIKLGNNGNKNAIFVLTQALEDKNFYDYFWAVYALRQISDETAVSAINKVLENPDPEVRKKATEALWQINAEVAVTTLSKSLKDIDPYVRHSAVIGLGQIGNDTAISILKEALLDESFSVRSTTCSIFKKIGSDAAVSFLAMKLWDKDSEACIKIAIPSTDASSIKIIGDEKSKLRAKVLEVLGLLGNDSAIPTLIYALYDEDSQVYSNAAIALGRIGSNGAISALILALDHWNFGLRSIAAYVLGEFVGSEVAIPALQQALVDEYTMVCDNAAAAIEKICTNNHKNIENKNENYTGVVSTNFEKTIIKLRQGLRYEDVIACGNAIKLLEESGNKTVIPDLLQAWNIGNTVIRWLAASAIGKIGNSELLPRLAKLVLITEEESLFAAISSIQNRCKYYNYEIYTSLAPEKQSPENTIIDTLNTLTQTLKTMSDTPKVQMNFHEKVYGAAGNVEHDQIVNVQNQNLAESAAEIQQLLEQLAKNNQAIVQSDDRDVVVSAIHDEIKRNPTIKARLWNALKAGGTEALKLALDAIFKNPAVSISVETIKGFIEAE